ncbi:myosin heavy chain, muscle-like [Temnothorax curvispinosus]|uniref:Myosin heavy chain, muscle-like n=1 Tax=Temnothorax curvispinosus TaxID=300111 RepID=A0A6J1QTI9_9HYME|nr:myosin heavy chain, muscle-like [Temnothorax curvispinosus]
MKTAEENKTCQSIETKIKIENTEEQLEDAEEHNYQMNTSQEDIKNEIKEEITEENTSRQINTASNTEEQIEIKEEIGENAEENAEKRNKLINRSEEDYIEERITEMEREINEKLSDIKREEVGEPFDKKDDSFIHIKRVRTYLRSGSEDSSDDPGKQDDLKHKNKRLKLNKENKEDTYQRSENEAKDSKEDPENDDSYEKWKKLKDYYKRSSDEPEDEEEYNRWKRRKKQVMEIINKHVVGVLKQDNEHRAERCRGEGAVEQENSKPANVANPATKVKSLLAERFHVASCSRLTDSEIENEEEDNNSENKDTEERDNRLESPDEIMLSESSMSEGEEREIANCFNQIQEIINRRFNGNNVNNDNQQRENANEHPEDNNSSDGHSRNDENGKNQPEENEIYDSEEERTIISSRGSTRSFNSTLEEKLCISMKDPSEIVFSEQERLNVISYSVKFRSNPGHRICEPINGEIEVATSDAYETTLTRVRDTLRSERHNGRLNRAAVVNGHSRARVHRAQKSFIDNSKVPKNNKMSREKRRLERWEDNLQRKVKKYTDQQRMLGVRQDRIMHMERYERELSPMESDDETYDREEISAQNKTIKIIKECERARGRNVFDVGTRKIKDDAGNEVADIKTIYVVRDLRKKDDRRQFSYEINATITQGTVTVTTRASEINEATPRAIASTSATTTSSTASTPRIMIMPQQLAEGQQQLIVLPSGDMGTLRKIAPKTSSVNQPIPAQQQPMKKKGQQASTEKDRRSGQSKSKSPATKSNKPTVIKTEIIKKQQVRKSATKAKKQIKRYSKEITESSSEEERQEVRPEEQLKLPTRVDEIKKSVLSKILIKDLPRRMKPTAAPSVSASTSELSGVTHQPTEAAQTSDSTQGMEKPYEKPGEPTNPDTENIEGAEDCSFESVASTQILSPIEEIISEAIRLEQGQPVAIQPAGHGEVPTQPAGHGEAYIQPAGHGEAPTQPAGHGEAIKVITGQPRSTGDDDEKDFGLMSQPAPPGQ